MTKSIIIYDGDCPYCKIATASIQNIQDDINIIDWNHKLAQDFLSLQFDGTPFSLVFIDPTIEKVWLGEDAIYEITKRSKKTKTFSSILKNNYKNITKFINFTTNREREIDKYEGIQKLDKSTSETIDQIIEESKTIDQF